MHCVLLFFLLMEPVQWWFPEGVSSSRKCEDRFSSSILSTHWTQIFSVVTSQAAYTKTNHFWMSFHGWNFCCLASPWLVSQPVAPLSRPQPLGPPRFRAVSDRAWWPSQVPGDSAGSVRPKSHDAAHLGPGWISPWKKRPGVPGPLQNPQNHLGAPKLVFSVVMKFDQNVYGIFIDTWMARIEFIVNVN